MYLPYTERSLIRSLSGPWRSILNRHSIHSFDFTALDGKEKWTTYKFTKNVYDIWIPTYFKRICSVIDQLPANIDFSVSELQSSEASKRSQFFDDQNLLQQSNPDTTSLTGTSNTSLTYGIEPRAFKKPKKGTLKNSSISYDGSKMWERRDGICIQQSDRQLHRRG